MSNRYLQEATALIRDQQGPRGPIWMCGEQLEEAYLRNALTAAAIGRKKKSERDRKEGRL